MSALFFSSLFLSLFLSLTLGRLAPRIGLMDLPNQSRKTHVGPVPLVGGIAIWTATMLVVLLFHRPFPWKEWWWISLMGFVGLWDDWRECTPWSKLVLQFLVAFGLWFFVLKGTHFLGDWKTVLFCLGSVGWMVLLVNAINYTDNIHGLCGGSLLVMMVGLIVIGMSRRCEPFYLVVLAGGILGFLFTNFPSGKIFLGDMGSHFLGSLIAVETIRLWESAMEWGWIAPLLLVSFPLIDFIQVTMGRLFRGQPIWQGDANHLSHLLVRRGFTLIQAVLILWGVTVLGVLAAILLMIV